MAIVMQYGTIKYCSINHKYILRREIYDQIKRKNYTIRKKKDINRAFQRG